MAQSLVDLCAREVVSDHSSSPCWLRWLPRELYGALLQAAFSSCRPLAVSELVHRWPERSLMAGGRRKAGQRAPNRLCIQALLLAVVRGLSDQRSALRFLDLCGLQGNEGSRGDPMGGWSLTVALCTMVVQARAGAQKREGERKRFSALERATDVKRERGKRREKACEGEMKEAFIDDKEKSQTEEEMLRGVRRRMEMDRSTETPLITVVESQREKEGNDLDSGVLVHVRADMFVSARSWERFRVALSTSGPLKLQCRYLRVEEISVSSIKTLLGLLPQQGLLGLDVRYSNLGVSGLVQLLPILAVFPDLHSLRLHYCNLDFHREDTGRDETLRELSQGLSQLKKLKRLSLTALRLPGHLRVLLSSLPQPLEVLEVPYLRLSPSDLAYLSCSHHASSLQQLDLSDNRMDGGTMICMRRLLSNASATLQHLSLIGCGLTDDLLALLKPSLGGCSALKSLAFALNPLTMAGLLDLVRIAVKMPALKQLLYPTPLEDFQPGLPDLPSSAQLLDWPLDESMDPNVTSSQLNLVLIDSGRFDLILTCDLLNYDKDLPE